MEPTILSLKDMENNGSYAYYCAVRNKKYYSFGVSLLLIV